MKKGTGRTIRNIFTNPRGGISLIVLVITIIVVIILAAAVIISLQNNNPMVEANKARINSDVANMQAIFTNTVGKIMAENQDVVQVVGGQLYTTPTGEKKTEGVATYQILGTDGAPVVVGKIKFSTEKSEGTTYCTGKELPLYSSDTKWSVDNQGLLSVEVGGVMYGEGSKGDNPPVEEGEEIVQSENPMLQSWKSNSSTDFHASEYKSKITKIKFTTADKVSDSKIESWDVSQAQDKSVMAWIESDSSEGYILTIASKSKIVANTKSSYLFYNFTNLKEIENLKMLDTSNATEMNAMFSECSSLIDLDLSNFNTSNVEKMNAMFSRCNSLTSLDLSNFNTGKVTNMYSMFSDCTKLTNINLSSFYTGILTTMSGMFENCNSLENLDLSNFIYSKSTTRMFKNCTSLSEIKFNENFNLLDVEQRDSMFENCYKLSTTLTLKFSGGGYTESNIFLNAATISSAQITLNYNKRAETKPDNYIEEYPDSNIVKGIQVD